MEAFMELIINERKVQNPVVIVAMVLFALSLVGAGIALVLFVLLPMVGIFLSSVLALVLIIVTPVLLWLFLPIIFLTLIAWFFGKFLT
jgi:hypothetical protein